MSSSCSRCPQSVVVSVALVFALFQQTCSAKHHTSCPSSSCGELGDIKYPFRLKGNPGGCGLPSYEFDCVNNRTLLTLFSGKYYVKEINYDRYHIRVIDSGVVEDTFCSLPRYFLSYRNFSGYDTDPLNLVYGDFYATVVFLNCSNRVGDDPRYVEVKAGCCDSGGVIYAVDLDTGFTVMDVKAGCRLKVATFTNVTHDGKVSYADILKSLEEGFWLTWLPVVCRDQCGKGIDCDFNQTTQQIQCLGCEMFNHGVSNCGILSRINEYIRGYVAIVTRGFANRIKNMKRSLLDYDGGEFIGQDIIPIFIAVRYLFGLSLLLVLFLYKWRRRHFSVYENIENFLLDKYKSH